MSTRGISRYQSSQPACPVPFCLRNSRRRASAHSAVRPREACNIPIDNPTERHATAHCETDAILREGCRPGHDFAGDHAPIGAEVRMQVLGVKPLGLRAHEGQLDKGFKAHSMILKS
jgi:hypothetical protein